MEYWNSKFLVFFICKELITTFGWIASMAYF